MRRILIATCLTVLASPAVAQDIPAIDADKNCRAVAARIGEISPGRGPDQCIRSENESLAALRKEWGEFAAADRARCTARAKIGVPSYTQLLTCLEIARDVRRLPKDSDDGLSVGLAPKD